MVSKKALARASAFLWFGAEKNASGEARALREGVFTLPPPRKRASLCAPPHAPIRRRLRSALGLITVHTDRQKTKTTSQEVVFVLYGYLPFGQRVAPCRSLASGDHAFVAPSAPMHRRALHSVLSEIPRTGHQNEKSTSNEVLRYGDPYGNRTHVSSVRG